MRGSLLLLLVCGLLSLALAQDTAKFTTYFAGGLPFCSQCGTPGQYACSPDASGRTIGQWNNGVVSFFDPVPTGSYATRITVIVYGCFSCNVVGQRAVFGLSLNGFTHGVRDTFKGTSQCKCDTCDGSETFDFSFRNGVPKYIYRSTNTLKIENLRDSLCINRVEVSIAYSPIVASPPTPLPEDFLALSIPSGYDRVGCGVCNAGLNQWCSASGNNSLQLSFRDPLPSNSLLISVDFYLSFGMVERAITSYSTIAGSLAGTAVGRPSVINDSAWRDKCQCLTDLTLSSDSYQRGWPSYSYNGVNRLNLDLVKYSQSYGNICIGRLNVKLIYYRLTDGELSAPEELLVF